MERIILHSDLNNFFASVEMLLNPTLRGKPVAVCGDPASRHGVVLAKNEEAKKFGIQTAETIYSARRKCPALVCVGTHFAEYKKYSALVKQIYLRYTEFVEAFSIDECWLDVTSSTFLFGSGEQIAERIRNEIKNELSLTVSIGVSFNKTVAKMASDLKKPDAVTVIKREDFESKVYPLPVSSLLYVGKSTAATLKKNGISTIGQLAAQEKEYMERLLGKLGVTLLSYARGEENEPVSKNGEEREIKSIGNSVTLSEDVSDKEEIKRIFFDLSESVAERLSASGLKKATTIHIAVKDCYFTVHAYQTKVKPTSLCEEIAEYAFRLYEKNYTSSIPVRMLGVSISDFSHGVEQLDFFSEGKNKKGERAAEVFYQLRKKYGKQSISRGILLKKEGEKKQETVDRDKFFPPDDFEE